MTSAQARSLAHQVIKNDPQSLRPFILLLYGLRESRGDPSSEDIISEVLGDLFVQTDKWEEIGLKDYVSLAA